VGAPTLVDPHRATVYRDEEFHKAMDLMERMKLIPSEMEWRDWPFKVIRTYAKRWNMMRRYGGTINDFVTSQAFDK